jgi:predicted amidohydrolase YtcJ
VDAQRADIAFVNGRVQTMGAARRWVRAVAVRDGRIVAVGTDAEIRPHVSSGTAVVDLDDRMVLPGFQDAHVHPVSGGLNRLQADLTSTDVIDHYLEIVRRYADEHPAEEWITGAGWSLASFPGGTPTADVLDRAVSDRPVLLRNRDGHGAWVNSRALQLAGIGTETPDPPDGRIERDDGGQPTGTLHEGAVDLVRDLIPALSRDRLVEGLLEGQRHLHRLGITAWQDAIIGTYDPSMDTLTAYRSGAERGLLTAKVVGALWWDRDRGPEQIDELMERRDSGSFGRFRARTVKIMQDGVCENFTAAVLDPYLGADGRPTDDHGISFVDPSVLNEAVTRLDTEGFQVHVHAIGERAVREALDAFEAARAANGPSAGRHHIAHIQVIHPDDLPRFHQLDVIANAQPLWAAHEPQMDELTIPFLGPQRAAWQYPFRDLEAAGATIAFGSDWPVSSPDPLDLIHVAVNRIEPDRDPRRTEPFLPDQRLSLGTALAAATVGGAYVNHLDQETGTIEIGRAADLVVLDRNLFTVPPERIAETEVLLTVVDGEVVHDRLRG